MVTKTNVSAPASTTLGGESIVIDPADRAEADKITAFDATVGLGNDFLQGMAGGVQMTYQQRMAVKALEASVNAIGDNITINSAQDELNPDNKQEEITPASDTEDAGNFLQRLVSGLFGSK